MQQECGWWLGRPLMAETQAVALGQTDLREPLCGGAPPSPVRFCLYPSVGPGVMSGTCEVQKGGCWCPHHRLNGIHSALYWPCPIQSQGVVEGRQGSSPCQGPYHTYASAGQVASL